MLFVCLFVCVLFVFPIVGIHVVLLFFTIVGSFVVSLLYSIPVVIVVGGLLCSVCLFILWSTMEVLSVCRTLSCHCHSRHGHRWKNDNNSDNNDIHNQ